MSGKEHYLNIHCKLLALLCLSFFTARGTDAQGCIPPDRDKEIAVAKYLTEKYNTPSSTALVLVESSRANPGCYWKLRYATGLKQEITVYLTPDGQYLTPTLYDLNLDPLAEQRALDERTEKSLLTDESPMLGARDAPVTIVEFSDFECPYCRKLADLLKQANIPGQGEQVRLVFKYFPLANHPWAREGAVAAACAASQNSEAFWKMHDFLFLYQKVINLSNMDIMISSVAGEIGLDTVRFETCLKDQKTFPLIARDEALGQTIGVRATPTIFINGARIEGIQTVEQLRLAISNASAPASSLKSALSVPPAAGQYCLRPE